MKKLLIAASFFMATAFASAQSTHPAHPVQAKPVAVQPTKIEKKATTAKPAMKLKADGTPDKRYKANKHLKADGTPDRRFKENK